MTPFIRKLRNNRLFISTILTSAMLAISVAVAWALPTDTTIDGTPSDWDDAFCLIDNGGVDDESSPTRADITEFCAHVDANYFYTAMAWDNTSLSGGTASTAGVRLDVDGDGVFDFIILATMAGNPITVDGYSVGTCDAMGACTNADDVCSSDGTGGGPCTGALAAAGDTWDDPFDPAPGHSGGSTCSGTNCTSQDGFIEIAIPWSLLGLTGPPSPQIFGDYGSYPSGPAQAPKDTVDSDGGGIACLADGTCFEPEPTTIALSAFSFSNNSSGPGSVFGIIATLLMTTTAAIAVISRFKLPAVRVVDSR